MREKIPMEFGYRRQFLPFVSVDEAFLSLNNWCSESLDGAPIPLLSASKSNVIDFGIALAKDG